MACTITKIIVLPPTFLLFQHFSIFLHQYILRHPFPVFKNVSPFPFQPFFPVGFPFPSPPGPVAPSPLYLPRFSKSA